MDTKHLKRLLQAVSIILSIIIVYCVYIWGDYLWDSHANSKLNSQLQEIEEQTKEKQEIRKKRTMVKEPVIMAKYEPLLEINDDVTGWVKIEGTKINYPVVQWEDNDYYLNHNIEKKDSQAGAIFMDFRNDKEGNNKNTILYGHHMKDDSMFNSLMGYKKQSFYKEHPIIEFDNLYEDMKWEIFSVYITDVDFYYIQTDFHDEETYNDFLKQIKEKSLYDTGVEVNKDDRILTLSTCTYEFNNARFAVHAKLVK